MRVPLGLRRRASAPEPDGLGPALVVAGVDDRVVVSVHRPLDETSTPILRDVVDAVIEQAGGPAYVELDVRAAPSCSAASLTVIGRYVERGVRLRIDELCGRAGDERAGAPCAHVEATP